MNKIISKSAEIAGRTMSLEVGRLAGRATSSVLATYGETVVHVAVTLGGVDPKKDYFPMSVDFQERLYAGGRIKGSRWVKREGKGTDQEILSGRLIDRSVRPLFPASFKQEVQVIVTVLAIDNDNDADILAVNAVSAALAISPIPWAGPVGCTRIGLDGEKLISNPANGKRNAPALDLVVTSTSSLIDMIEAGATQIPEAVVYQGFELGFAENQKVIALINSLVAEVGAVKLPVPVKAANPELEAQVAKAAKDILAETVTHVVGKSFLDREHAYNAAKDGIAAGFEDKDKPAVKEILEDLLKKAIRDNILTQSVRMDGRKPEDLRDLSISVGVLPRVHGSGIFQRGETQALTITTLGAPSLSQTLESAEGEEIKRYIHHYSMPPYATGETGRVGQPGRREIGHGALAERALAPVIPPEDQFPYTIRVVSEIMSSNGSTSMASTCGSTLSLMDAGVPLLAPVAGISTGLITPSDYPAKTDKYILLTDINGAEDHYGDMDFKVAGTDTGITAIQLDVKVPGLTLEICKATLANAKRVRTYILSEMLKVIPAYRDHLAATAPKIHVAKIPTDKIGELIGPGGKNIKKLMADTETQVDVRDDGSVFISGQSAPGVEKAIAFVTGLGKEVVPGEIYEGTVVTLQNYGAFVNILPGKDGLVHVSRMSHDYVGDPSTLLHEGQVVKVWVTEIDGQGRINLSMVFDENGQPASKIVEPRRDDFSERRPQRSFDRGGAQHDRFSAPMPRRSGPGGSRGPGGPRGPRRGY